MARFDSAIALVRRLLLKNGAAVTLRTMTPGAANGAQPWRPGANAPVNNTARAVFLPYNDQGRSPKTYADGTTARVGDMQVYMEADALTVQPDLTSLIVRADGSLWAMKDLALLDPNGQKIVYELWVRQ